ncbi:hypothetical protein SprV_0100022800 [Sparganum proliferum]
MNQTIPRFQIPAATTFKPKVVKVDDYSKLTKEGERLLSFYPHYVEVAKAKKGKQDVKRLIRLSDVTEVRTDAGHPNLLRVFVNNKGKNECHQMLISNRTDLLTAKAYFDKDAASGSVVSPFPSEAVPSVRPPSQVASEKSSSKRPASSALKKPPKGRDSAASGSLDGYEPRYEPKSKAFSVSTVRYDEQTLGMSAGPKPSVRMSGVEEVSNAETTSYTGHRQSTLKPPSYAYYGDNGSTGEWSEGDAFNNASDKETDGFSHNSRSHGRPFRRKRVKGSSQGRDSVPQSPIMFTEEDYRHLLLTPTVSQGDSETYVEACSTCYGDDSEETLVEMSRRPRSLPYYCPFLPVRTEESTCW